MMREKAVVILVRVTIMDFASTYLPAGHRPFFAIVGPDFMAIIASFSLISKS